MQKRKMPRDPNSLAAKIVAMSTGQPTPGQSEKPPVDDGKNPNAVALGRLGGLKGGKARAAKLSAEERARIAQTAAKKRWESRKP